MNSTDVRKQHQLDPDWVFLWFVIGGWGGLMLVGSVWEQLPNPIGAGVITALMGAFTAVGLYAFISRHFWKIFIALLMLLLFTAARM